MTAMIGALGTTWRERAAYRLGERGGVVALAALSLLLWLPYLTFPLDADAAGYAVAAYWWARGDTLYEEITITRPQGIFVIFRLIEFLHLDSAPGNRLVSALWAVACALVLLALVRRVWGRALGFASAATFVFLAAAPHAEGYSTNAELFMLLPALGALWCLWSAGDLALATRREHGRLVGCGLLLALAILIKPTAAPLALFCGAWLLYRRRAAGRAWAVARRACALVALGGALGLGPALVHGLATAPAAYLDAVLLYRLRHDSVAASTGTDQLVAFITSTTHLLTQLPILLVGLGGLWHARPRALAPADIFLLGWVVAAFGGVAMGGNWFPHYYLPLLAPLAVAVARSIARLVPSKAATMEGQRSALARFAGGALIVVLAIISIINATTAIFTPALTFATTTARSEQVAAYLRVRTVPDDTIYVTYQWPSVYQLAERKPATRWLYYRELQRTPGAFAEQVARISDPRTAPRYIIAAQPFDEFGLDSAGTFRAAIEQFYILETTIQEIPIYRHR